MMKRHISSLPDEILEAAGIDGAGEDFLWPYLVINDSKKQLLPVGLKLFAIHCRNRRGSGKGIAPAFVMQYLRDSQ